MAEIEKKAVINIETNGAEKNTQSLKARMKEVREEMQRLAGSGDRTSEAYQRLAEESGELARVQREVAKDTAEASTTFSNTISYTAGALAGVSGAVQTATAALSMMGVEMGDDSKLMKVLVSAMSFTSGLQAIQSGVEAFKLLRTNIMRSTTAQKALNLAMKANPWMLLASAVAAVATSVVLFSKASAESERNIRAAEKAMNDFNKESSKMKDNQQFAYNMAEAFCATKEELHELRREQLKANWDEAAAFKDRMDRKMLEARVGSDEWEKYRDLAKEAAQKEEEAYQAFNKYNMEVIKTEAAARKKAKEDAAKAWAERKKQLEGEKATEEDIRRAKLEMAKDTMTELDYTKELLEIEKDRLEVLEKQDKLKGKEYQSKEALQQKQKVVILEARVSALETALRKQMDEKDKEESEKFSKEMHKENILEEEQIYMERKKAIYESGEKEIDFMLNQVELQRFYNQKSLLKEELDFGLISRAEYENKLTEMELNESIKRRQIADDERKAKEEIAKLREENIKELVSKVTSSIGGIADGLDEETEEYKFLKAAQATIDTISAAVSAFAGITEGTNGWGIASAIATATTVLATGYANVKKIYAVKKDGVNDTSVSTAAVGTLTRNYTNARLTDGSGGEIDLSEQLQKGIGSIRVWVSERDISEAQNNSKKVILRNTF